MTRHWHGRVRVGPVALVLLFLLLGSLLVAAPAAPRVRGTPSVSDSSPAQPPADLALQPAGERKAGALVRFVEGQRLEEAGEIDRALQAYQKVLTVNPGELELALHVASLLVRQEDYPRAIDVLKDALKERPNAAEPYLQLAQIYSRHLRKHEQAARYAEKAVELDPANIEAHQRLYEVEAAAGRQERGLAALARAAALKNDDPAFWVRLGKLYAAVLLKDDAAMAPEDLQRINAIFRRAAASERATVGILKEVADYFAASRQLAEAIPLYLRVLELQPDDINAREKLATGFVLTNQRPQAIAMLEELIAKDPARAQAYELLGGVYEDEGRALDRQSQEAEARSMFTKAAQSYEQALLINPGRPSIYLRLAELLLARTRDNERAVRILQEARARFPGAPEMTYYLAIALREAKQSKEAVARFGEALAEAEAAGASIASARFYFDYGTAAEQAGFYDKAADLFRTAISMDPPNSAEACNYLGYMLAEQNMHLEEAEDMVRRALAFDPDNGAYLDSMGWVRFRQGQFQEALEFLLKAVQRLTRDDPTVFEHIGDVYAKLNDTAKALEFYQRAALLDPAAQEIAEKIESLKTKVSQGATPAGSRR